MNGAISWHGPPSLPRYGLYRFIFTKSGQEPNTCLTSLSVVCNFELLDDIIAGWVHWTRQSMGEWLYRIIQRQAARWITQPRDLLHSERSPDLDRTLEKGLQSHPSTQLIRISSPSTTSLVAFNEHAARTNIKIGTKNWGWSPERLPFLQKNQITNAKLWESD